MQKAVQLAILLGMFGLQACVVTTDGSFTGNLDGSTEPTSQTPTSPIMDMDPFQAILNDERRANSLSDLGQNTKLATAAQNHADDMSIQNYFSHTSADGRTLGDRLREVDYDYCWGGENIAYGYRTNEAVFTAWMNSPGHRANMMSTSADEFGLGYAEDGHYWVMVLGNTC